MKTFISLTILFLLFSGEQVTVAQKIDKEKMDKDLKVAEAILASLTNQSSNADFRAYSLPKSPSRYLEGYGVIFHVDLPPSFVFVAAPAQVLINHQRPDNVTSTITSARSITPTKPDSLQKSKLAETLSVYGLTYTDKNESDSLKQADVNRSIEQIKTFLLDYADLIGQLKEDDKIKVIESNPTHLSSFANSQTTRGSNARISAEIVKKDLNEYKSGKISREELSKRIKITTRADKEPVDQDFVLLGSIFERLYRTDLSNTYFLSGAVYYNRIPDYGVIYHMNVNTYERAKVDQVNNVYALSLDDVNQEERNKKVTELYPKFENELKENILEYGKTLKNLDDNEYLIFDVSIAGCRSCDIPEFLQLSVKSAVLRQYNTGKLTKNTALGEVKIVKDNR